MIKKGLFVVLTLALFTSCGSLRRGSSKMDQSPYASGTKDDGIEVRDDQSPEGDGQKKSEPEIVIRKEKVRSVDLGEKDEHIYKYYVIIGSFRYLDNARSYKKDLIKEDFVPVILENENGLFRVSVAAYNEENPARQNIASIRRNYNRYSDVWLLIRKK
jgi:hypothetical protein